LAVRRARGARPALAVVAGDAVEVDPARAGALSTGAIAYVRTAAATHVALRVRRTGPQGGRGVASFAAAVASAIAAHPIYAEVGDAVAGERAGLAAALLSDARIAGARRAWSTISDAGTTGGAHQRCAVAQERCTGRIEACGARVQGAAQPRIVPGSVATPARIRASLVATDLAGAEARQAFHARIAGCRVSFLTHAAAGCAIGRVRTTHARSALRAGVTAAVRKSPIWKRIIAAVRPRVGAGTAGARRTMAGRIAKLAVGAVGARQAGGPGRLRYAEGHRAAGGDGGQGQEPPQCTLLEHARHPPSPARGSRKKSKMAAAPATPAPA